MQSLWTLTGSGVLQLRTGKSATAFVHYENSPVGAYDEFAVVELSLRGPSVTEMLVTSAASREAGRALWGFPKEVASLNWRQNGKRIVFEKEDETFRFRSFGFSFPLKAKGWTNQILDGQNVRVSFAIQGRARLAFRGKQIAVLLENFTLEVFAPITDNRSQATQL